ATARPFVGALGRGRAPPALHLVRVDSGSERRRIVARALNRDVDILDVLRERIRAARVPLVNAVDRLRSPGLRAEPKALGDPIDQLEPGEVVEEPVAIA